MTFISETFPNNCVIFYNHIINSDLGFTSFLLNMVSYLTRLYVIWLISFAALR